MPDKPENTSAEKANEIGKFFSIRNLEFKKIISKLVSYAHSSLGKNRALGLLPLRIPWRIIFHQKETSEARLFLDREERLPSFGNLNDVRHHVTLSMKGSILTIFKLWNIAATIRTVRLIKESLTNTIGVYPILHEYAEHLTAFHNLEETLFRSIEDEETIADKATPDLRKYRHNLREKNFQIQERSKRLSRKYADRNMLTDSTFTIRNNRYVLPFSSGSMGREKIVIQSTSESGLTFYGEPLELVELNNELQKAYQLVRNEEEKIMQMLSAQIGLVGEQLNPSIEICGYLDFIFAKGYLSRDLNAVEPGFNSQTIKLEQIRHPLIKKDVVVPIDLDFTHGCKGLIITGPNAGGKTVSIKTLGLTALMAQAGLHIPAKDKSAIPIFRSILAEIGDAQSIDLDLSSFGAHIMFLRTVIKSLDDSYNPSDDASDKWIDKYHSWQSRGKEVTKDSDDQLRYEFSPYDILQSDSLAESVKTSCAYDDELQPLILLDEIGRSTDPEEGSAIALALIDRLIEKGAFFALTTHLPALKNLVLEESSPITGAAMGFDLDKMNTTYKVENDTIGASYGIVIAEKMGLEPELLKNARERMSGRFNLLEIDIPRLESKRDELMDYVSEWETKKRIARREELRELSRLLVLKKMGMEYLLSSVDKGQDVLKDAQKKSSRLIELSRKGKKVQRDFDKKRSKLNKLRNEIEESYAALKRMGKVDGIKDDTAIPEFEFEKGQRVWVSVLNREGVIDKIKKQGKRMLVVFDNKKMEIDSSQAVPVQNPEKKKEKSKIQINIGPRKSTSLCLDLHGERVEPALEKVEEFLHDAVLDNRAQVNIIHGIGTGTLRKAVRKFLVKHPLVKSFRDGDPSEGAIGVTIVEFKRQDDE
ncbi:Smr/MutS family protein [bacterium]|nr:Smr/MutS family protein [bacterium]